MKKIFTLCVLCLFMRLAYGQTQKNKKPKETKVSISNQQYFTATLLNNGIANDEYVSLEEPISSREQQSISVIQKTLLLEISIDSIADT